MTLNDLGSQERGLYLRVTSAERRRTRNGTDIVSLRLADSSGALPATIFQDHHDFKLAGRLKAGDVVALRASRGSYQGAPQLEITRIRELDERDTDRWNEAEVFGAELAKVRDLIAEKLVMDIETAPLTGLDSMPASLAEEVTRIATEREWPIDKVLALNPLFSRVVSIAIGNAEREDGHVLLAPLQEDLGPLEGDAPEWLRPMSEGEMLSAFWGLASAAELVITFNGRNFDLPFLRNRSAILDIAVIADLLSQPPYQHSPHLDLYQILAGGGHGARPTTLDAACFAFGIESPKGAMDGSMIAEAFAGKQYLEIAKYNLADIDATRKLYHRLRGTVIDYLT